MKVSKSTHTLLRNPFSTDAAFTDNDRGILIVFSRITEQKIKQSTHSTSQNQYTAIVSQEIKGLY